MKAILTHCLIVLFSAFMFSCAKPGITPRTHIPPENLPQIDGKQPSSSIGKSRPAIVEIMIEKARKELRQNRPEQAFQILERALAIDGRDPMVWHLMARVRQVQGRFGQADSLARKSNTLASDNPSLMEKNRQIISDVGEK